ncbi:MAG: rubredoxin [Betaproteobacteria bacterium]|nr:rubredoxin [Betaproteobacteria bacterium]
MSAKHRCKHCGYVYDPALGDLGPGPGRNYPPGTSFESLPGSWCCPDCRAPKADFEPITGVAPSPF